jgi:hypothetical protein
MQHSITDLKTLKRVSFLMIFLCFSFAFPEPAGICLPRLQLAVSRPAGQHPGSVPRISSFRCLYYSSPPLRIFRFSVFCLVFFLAVKRSDSSRLPLRKGYSGACGLRSSLVFPESRVLQQNKNTRKTEKTANPALIR